MKKMKAIAVQWILLCFSLLPSTPLYAYCPLNSFKCAQNQHPFGIIATSALLDEMEQTLAPTPPDSTIKDNWLIHEITKTSKKADHPMLDIGGGYGHLSKAMLKSGATVIYNDIEPKHLIYGRQLALADERQRLYLNSHKFPRSMILEPNSLSGVVLYRVAHFMKPDEFEEGIAKIKRWLVPGGKIFIAVTPQPKQHHFMDERPLIQVLTKYGFTIDKYGFIDMNQETQSRTGQELFGIIAIKSEKS
jgi:SAM-dependent methyltransferase